MSFLTSFDSRRNVRRGFSLCLLILCGAFVAEYLALSQEASLNDPRFHSNQNPALTRKLIFIDVDGLRRDFAFDPTIMPTMASLASRGASGTALTSGMTLSIPAIKAWFVGTRFVARDFAGDFWGTNANSDSVVERAHLKGLRVACSAPPEWRRSFGKYFDINYTADAEDSDIARVDRTVQAHAREFVQDSRTNLLIVHYLSGDMAAHDHGTKDGHYAAALRQIDSYLRELVELAPKDSTVVVASDHGTTDEGSHYEGGDIVIHPPFVFAGKGIRHVADLELHQVDIAPTLAALLGLDFPSSSVGGLALDVLEGSPEDDAKWETAYAASRLHALELSGLESSDASSNDAAARRALSAGRFPKAIELAQSVERECNFLIQGQISRRSSFFFACALALGLAALALLFLILLPVKFQRLGGRNSKFEIRKSKIGNRRSEIGDRNPEFGIRDSGFEDRESPPIVSYAGRFESSPLGSAATFGLFVCGLAVIWALSTRYQGEGARQLWPFRYVYLVHHWKQLAFILVAGGSFLAYLSHKLPLPRLAGRWQITLVGWVAALFISNWQPHDVAHWLILGAIVIFSWRSVLFFRDRLPEAAAYGCLFAAALLARLRIHHVQQGFGSHFWLWLCLLAFVSIPGAFLVLSHTFSRTFSSGSVREKATQRFARTLQQVPAAAWLLLALAFTAQSARLFRCSWAEGPLLLAVAACLGWRMLAKSRTADSLEFVLSMAILAAAPVLFPPQCLPVMALALIAFSLTARRLARQNGFSSFGLAVFSSAAILFLFFALSGDFDMQVIDIKRRQLLDPFFSFNYFSVARIGLLMLLQLLLPTLIVMSSMAHLLKRHAAVWLRMAGLVRLFFMAQIVTLTVYLKYRTAAFNGLYWNLAEFLTIFLVYVVVHIASQLADRLTVTAGLDTEEPSPVSGAETIPERRGGCLDPSLASVKGP